MRKRGTERGGEGEGLTRRRQQTASGSSNTSTPDACTSAGQSIEAEGMGEGGREESSGVAGYHVARYKK